MANRENPRIQVHYSENVIPKMIEEFQYKNKMMVPRLEKIVLNMGLGKAIQNIKIMDGAKEELAQITGQCPVITRAKKDIASFKLRKGVPIGCMVTLRGKMMFEFFDRLVNITFPRVRDFKGISPNSFDGRGSYTLGIKEQIIFPEIDYNKVESIKGMNITLVTTAKTDAEARALLKFLGMPFREA